jgi:propanediol utilization protein
LAFLPPPFPEKALKAAVQGNEQDLTRGIKMGTEPDKEEIRKIVEQVLEKRGLLAPPPDSRFPEQAPESGVCPRRIPAEASARHVHLTAEAAAVLFGPGAVLTESRALSQPGEFLSGERVRLIGPTGEIGNAAILGPLRKAVQVEISLTDARLLGVKAPLRLSGDLSGAADIYIAGPAGVIHARGSAIIARNHLHLRPQDARELQVENGARVRVRLRTERPLVFEEVIVRVREDFMPALHLDFDEANACMLKAGDTAEILEAPALPVPAQPSESAAKPAPPLPEAAAAKPVLVTEAEAKRLVPGSGGILRFPRGSILTPSAKDVFLYARCKVEFV